MSLSLLEEIFIYYWTNALSWKANFDTLKFKINEVADVSYKKNEVADIRCKTGGIKFCYLNSFGGKKVGLEPRTSRD